MDVENSNGGGIYKCDVCNFESQYSQNLQIHFKSLKHMTNIDAWTLEFTNNETNGFEEPKSNIRNSIGRYHSKFFVQVWHMEPSYCKKRQKSPNQETGLGNRGRLKVLYDTKLVLNEHE